MIDEEKELNEAFIRGGSKVWGVYKFPNGNVAVFGYNEQQVPMLQGPYTKALEEKIRQYSDEKTIWKGF